LPRSKIDFGRFDPMFAAIADLDLIRFLSWSSRWSASFHRPWASRSAPFGAERDHLLLSIPDGGFD